MLEKAEAENSLLLGLSLALRHHQFPSEFPPLCCILFEKNNIRLAAFQTPPRNLILANIGPLEKHHFHELTQDCIQHNIQLPGVAGERRQTETLARIWCNAHRLSWQVQMDQWIYELRDLSRFDATPGRIQLFHSDHVSICRSWIQAFSREALDESVEPDVMDRVIANRLKNGTLFLWMSSGEPVSMAAVSRPTANGISINYVYTPPKFRGRGYSSTLVSEVCRRMLTEKGFEFCVLYADADNPVSNHIYQKIGFSQIARHGQIGFFQNSD